MLKKTALGRRAYAIRVRVTFGVTIDRSLMHVDASTYIQICGLYRAQPTHRRPNHRAVAKIVGIDQRTLAGGYERGWPCTRRRPALPPIRDVLEGEKASVGVPAPRAVSAAPVAAEVPGNVATATPSPSIAPDPVVPPERDAEPVTPANLAAPSAPVAPPKGEPQKPISTPPVEPVPARSSPPDPLAAVREAAAKAILDEINILQAARTNAIGLLVTTQGLLKGLHDATPQIRARLISLAAEKPERAIELLGELAKVEAETVKSTQRIVEVQRVIAGLPSNITEHRIESRAPEAPAAAAARIRAVMAELAAANRGLDDYGRPLRIEPIDVAAGEG
jgi:hypothetical protein